MSFLRPSNHQNRSRNMGGEGALNRKTRDSERDFAENHKDHYLLLPSLPQSPNSGRCNGCGLWVPFNHALKRGSWLFCDGRLYKYKRGSECFCFGRGKGKKEENLLSVVVFRQYNTIDYTFWTKQHSTIQQWILPRSLTLYYPFSYHQSPFF